MTVSVHPTPTPVHTGPPRLCMGVLLPGMDGEYYRPLVAGLCRQARKLDVDLVFYPGGLPGNPASFEQQLSAAFELVDSSVVDGLVVSGSTLQRHLEDGELSGFLRRFQHLPLVSIGYEHDDSPTVMPDNRGGILALMAHLIHVHGHRRIAFIGGPQGNRDAHERLQAYEHALAAAGIEPDPRLRVSGEFSQASGRAAFEALLASNVPFSAIVAASDAMAHGVLAAAMERGLQVPGDLAVVGFDDVLSVRMSGPSLTTVDQDLDEQTGAALRTLAALIHGDPAPSVTTVPCRMVLRRSCGCGSGGVARAVSDRLNLSVPDAPAELADRLEADLKAIDQAWRDTASATRFEALLRDLTVRWLRHRSDLWPLQSLLIQMGHDLRHLPADVQDVAARRVHAGQLILVNARELAENQRTVETADMALDFGTELKARVATDDLDALLAALSEGLATLQITSCCIALYREPLTLIQMRTEGIPSSSRLILARDRGVIRPEWLGKGFSTCQLMPQELVGGPMPTARAVLPLFYLQSQFGFMVVDVDWGRSLSVEDLRHELSTYIHHCLLVRDLKQARDLLRSDLARAQRDNEALSHLAMRDELTGLFNRRGFFALAQTILATSRLTGKPVTLVFADLDGLKQINDVFGHEEGDEAIRVAASVLRTTFRQDDLVSRIGGDEFVVLTPMHSLGSLPEIERRLARAFDDHNRQAAKGYAVGCSLGGYPVPLDSQESLPELVAQADRLLYAAKRQKRAHGEGRSSKY